MDSTVESQITVSNCSVLEDSTVLIMSQERSHNQQVFLNKRDQLVKLELDSQNEED